MAYVVISDKDEKGKPKTKRKATGLKEGTSKRKLEAKQKEIVAEYEEELNRKKYAPIPSSLLLDSGISMKEIQMWLGHSNFGTTVNLPYGHNNPSSQYSIQNSLDHKTVKAAFVYKPKENLRECL